MTFYPEVMPPSQQKMLRRLGAIARDRGFYLAGGTALAIQVGHRRSVDFDWFSGSAIEYRYPDLVAPVEWPEYDVRLAGLEDLASMKLSAVGGRGSRRDFIDIFALGRERFTLDEMLDFYRRKYGVSDLGHTLYALSYFDDAERDDTPEMLWPIEWGEVKRTMERWVRDYVRRQAPP